MLFFVSSQIFSKLPHHYTAWNAREKYLLFHSQYLLCVYIVHVHSVISHWQNQLGESLWIDRVVLFYKNWHAVQNDQSIQFWVCTHHKKRVRREKKKSKCEQQWNSKLSWEMKSPCRRERENELKKKGRRLLTHIFFSSSSFDVSICSIGSFIEKPFINYNLVNRFPGRMG